jgi:DNA polymerase III alpha subunit
MNTQLHNYTLWFDGKITIEPQHLVDYLDILDSVSVTHLTSSVKSYNKLISSDQKISTKTCLNRIVNDWSIPDEFKKLDVCEFIHSLHNILYASRGWSEQELLQRNHRIDVELKMFEKYNLYPLLRALFFIINTFKSQNVVWGTGRGSSVSSYVLFLMEVHDVDSYEFQLQITDFLK